MPTYLAAMLAVADGGMFPPGTVSRSGEWPGAAWRGKVLLCLARCGEAERGKAGKHICGKRQDK